MPVCHGLGPAAGVVGLISFSSSSKVLTPSCYGSQCHQAALCSVQMGIAGALKGLHEVHLARLANLNGRLYD